MTTMSNETCNHVSDGRRCQYPGCGLFETRPTHDRASTWYDHDFEPGRPEEPKVPDETDPAFAFENQQMLRAEAIAPEPKPEPTGSELALSRANKALIMLNNYAMNHERIDVSWVVKVIGEVRDHIAAAQDFSVGAEGAVKPEGKGGK